MKWTVRCGMLSYWVFIAVTLLFVLRIARMPHIIQFAPRLLGALSSFDIVSLSVGLAQSSVWKIAPLYILLGAELALWASAVDDRLEATYGRCWHSVERNFAKHCRIKQPPPAPKS